MSVDEFQLEEAGRAELRLHLDRLCAVADACIEAGCEVLVAWVWPKDDGTLDKAPAHPHGHLDAHRDRQRIRQELIDPYRPTKRPPPDHAELAIGFVAGSGGLGVLDFDVKGGKVGKATYEALEAKHGPFVDSAWNSPSGGLDVLFAKPEGATYGNESPWQGVDVRVDSGWCVAPGTVTSWGSWRWRVGGFDTARALPEAMTAQLSAPTMAGRKATGADTVRFIEASPTTSTGPVLQAFDVEVKRFKASKQGSRHDALLRIVSWSFGMGALDLRWALERITVEWDILTAGEGREDEVNDIAAWVVGQEAPKRAAARPVADPVTGEIIESPRNLPAEFWERPELAKIRRWAHGRMRSADAVYAAVRARTCALIPRTLVIDTGIAVPISLNSLIAIVGSSGAGKSTAGGLGRQGVPIIRQDVYEGPLGSGEGVVELFFEMQSVPNLDGRGSTKQRVRTKDAALLLLDEGEMLTRMGSRKGTTIMPTLRSAWSGELLGQTNASADTRRVLAAGSYRFVLMVGLQDLTAAELFSPVEVAAGTPQRFVLFNANDPTIPSDAANVDPPWKDRPWVPEAITGPQGDTMELDDEVRAEIRERSLAVTRGDLVLDLLDSHRVQNRVKEAALLSILAGRKNIDAEDWRLAGMVIDTSDALRRWVIDRSHAAGQRIEDERTNAAVRRQRITVQALDHDAHERAVLRGAQAMARLGGRSSTAVTKRELSRAVAGRDRQEASVDEMIERAEAMDWLRPAGDDGWVAGGSKPS